MGMENVVSGSSLEQTLGNQIRASEAVDDRLWFAVLTRSRHEKKVDAALTGEGITTFLPLVTEVHRWSDRRQTVQLPLFPCYIFVHIAPLPATRLSVLRAQGVLSFVGIHGQGTPIPDQQIDDLRTLLTNKIALDPHPYLKVGQRVRVRGGCLDGVEGVLVAKAGESKVVISIDTIQKSLAISVRGYEIEPL